MKRYAILIIPSALALCVIAAVTILLGVPRETAQLGSGDTGWTVKEKEESSRLLEVPIILYHDIDGKGPFAVSSAMLRSHFEYFRDSNITVLPLSSLLERMNNPRPYTGRTIIITFDDGYKSMLTKLLPLVDEFHYPVTLFVYTDNVRDKAEKIITWDDLKLLQSHGVDIQSHTISHADLPKLDEAETAQSKAQLFRELYYSRLILEKRLGKPVDFLAFPYGRYSNQVIRYAMDAGYSRVFTTDYGSNVVLHNNYCIRRHHIKKNYTIKDLSAIIE
jgi:peptidoglycan/xylan/chitin deacetylase (PgdA/CDA1 family)